MTKNRLIDLLLNKLNSKEKISKDKGIKNIYDAIRSYIPNRFDYLKKSIEPSIKEQKNILNLFLNVENILKEIIFENYNEFSEYSTSFENCLFSILKKKWKNIQTIYKKRKNIFILQYINGKGEKIIISELLFKEKINIEKYFSYIIIKIINYNWYDDLMKKYILKENENINFLKFLDETKIVKKYLEFFNPKNNLLYWNILVYCKNNSYLIIKNLNKIPYLEKNNIYENSIEESFYNFVKNLELKYFLIKSDKYIKLKFENSINIKILLDFMHNFKKQRLNDYDFKILLYIQFFKIISKKKINFNNIDLHWDNIIINNFIFKKKNILKKLYLFFDKIIDKEDIKQLFSYCILEDFINYNSFWNIKNIYIKYPIFMDLNLEFIRKETFKFYNNNKYFIFLLSFFQLFIKNNFNKFINNFKFLIYKYQHEYIVKSSYILIDSSQNNKEINFERKYLFYKEAIINFYLDLVCSIMDNSKTIYEIFKDLSNKKNIDNFLNYTYNNLNHKKEKRILNIYNIFNHNNQKFKINNNFLNKESNDKIKEQILFNKYIKYKNKYYSLLKESYSNKKYN